MRASNTFDLTLQLALLFPVRFALKMNKVRRRKTTPILISLRVSRRGITSHDSGPVRFSRFGSTSRGSCLARFARFSRKSSIDFKLTSDTCSILRPATTRDGSLRPETTRYDRRCCACGSHSSVSRATVRMLLTVRLHKSRFACGRCSIYVR